MANISTVAPFTGVDHGRSKAAHPGILRRILTALMDAQQRKADREVAAILARHGDIAAYVRDEERTRSHRNYPMSQTR